MALFLFMAFFSFCKTIWPYPLFGERYCNHPDFSCITIHRGDSWARLFPSPKEQDVVRRLNRMNVFLKPKMRIAVPNNLSSLTANDISPFPPKIPPFSEKLIYILLDELAFAAYDDEGTLLRWGPISSGAKKCLEFSEGCLTPTGIFRILRKQGIACISSQFPERDTGENGGADMPFCMFFHQGYALHGSPYVPGYPASHGCLRLFVEDAKWLNENFVDLPEDNGKGTLVVIEHLR